jgi:hypothetical protein
MSISEILDSSVSCVDSIGCDVLGVQDTNSASPYLIPFHSCLRSLATRELFVAGWRIAALGIGPIPEPRALLMS